MPPHDTCLADAALAPATDVAPSPAAVLGAPLQLGSSLDLTAAEPLHRELRDRLAQHGTLTIDASEVERVSTPCLQVLAAAVASARALGGSVRFEAPSAVMSNAVRDLDLGRALGMEIAG